jgi:large subunit ribosomal protein L9
MRLLLRETVDQLGTIGDIVEVPDGYGRNYLLPKGIALAVTPENIRRLESKKQELLAIEAQKRQDATGLAERIKAKTIRINAKAAGEEGKLYGSVTAQAIAEAFRAQGLAVEARMILLDHPIKELGEFDLRIRVFAGVEAEAKVLVVDESLEAEKAAEAAAAQAKAERAAEREAAREAARAK